MMNLDLEEDVALGLASMADEHDVDQSELGNSMLRELLTSCGYIVDSETARRRRVQSRRAREEKQPEPRKTPTR